MLGGNLRVLFSAFIITCEATIHLASSCGAGRGEISANLSDRSSRPGTDSAVGLDSMGIVRRCGLSERMEIYKN